MNPNLCATFIEQIIADPEFSTGICHIEKLDEKAAQWAPLPGDLDDQLVQALKSRGITRLYSHQSEAYTLLRSGRDCVIVTPTASGKTLCYNLAVIQTFIEEPESRAIYLFPTKALSQDQETEFKVLCAPLAIKAQAFTYDGDTPQSLRASARNSGRIIITNPDMLHSGILPNHTRWARMFQNLKFIVIDEMHVYRGVFGSHVANVLRRLFRIAKHYGSNPRVILCSATIKNPAQLAKLLTGRELAIVENNGAARGGKSIVFYNPPLADPVRGLRKSSALESQRLMIMLLRKGANAILFARSRLKVELIASYINQELANPYNNNSGIQVKPYRAGLLPLERRAIEKGLKEGSIHGVVSTNALELGIDIGSLDASLIAGFPGTFASFWQQAGRAGRTERASLTVFIATASPLDQFILAHPEYFFVQNPEAARIDSNNPYIFADHLKCAAFELPFKDGETFGQGVSNKETQAGLEFLEDAGLVRHVEAAWHWSSDSYPAESVSLRTGSADNVVIVDASKGGHRVIGEMDRPGAKELLFDNAVYMHLGRQYMVEKLDIENKVCNVAEKDLDFWTDSIVKTDIEVLEEEERKSQSLDGKNEYSAVLCDVLVRSQVEKYKKLRFHTHENIGYGEVYLPPEEMHTRSLVVLFADEGRAAAILRYPFAHQGLTPDSPKSVEGALRTLPGSQNQPPDINSQKANQTGNFNGSQNQPSNINAPKAHEARNSTNIESHTYDDEVVLQFRTAILLGAARLMHEIAPVFLMCDPRDIGISERIRDPHFELPAMYFYDRYPGGTGLAEALAENLPAVFAAARDRVRQCTCLNGCPSCIGVDLFADLGDAPTPAGRGLPEKFVADFGRKAKIIVAQFLEVCGEKNA